MNISPQQEDPESDILPTSKMRKLWLQKTKILAQNESPEERLDRDGSLAAASATTHTEALCIPRTTARQLLARNTEYLLSQSVPPHRLVCSDDLASDSRS